MKPIKQIIIGSRAFFSGMKGYKPKDRDELCIMDSWFPKKTNVLNMKINGKDVFFFKNMTKEEFIQDVRDSGVSMRAGKFLVPEFAEFIGLTIEDLKSMSDLFRHFDLFHQYEEIIYDFYIENNGFFLTDEQREIAYNKYREYR